MSGTKVMDCTQIAPHPDRSARRRGRGQLKFDNAPLKKALEFSVRRAEPETDFVEFQFSY